MKMFIVIFISALSVYAETLTLQHQDPVAIEKEAQTRKDLIRDLLHLNRQPVVFDMGHQSSDSILLTIPSQLELIKDEFTQYWNDKWGSKIETFQNAAKTIAKGYLTLSTRLLQKLLQSISFGKAQGINTLASQADASKSITSEHSTQLPTSIKAPGIDDKSGTAAAAAAAAASQATTTTEELPTLDSDPKRLIEHIRRLSKDQLKQEMQRLFKGWFAQNGDWKERALQTEKLRDLYHELQEHATNNPDMKDLFMGSDGILDVMDKVIEKVNLSNAQFLAVILGSMGTKDFRVLLEQARLPAQNIDMFNKIVSMAKSVGRIPEKYKDLAMTMITPQINLQQAIDLLANSQYGNNLTRVVQADSRHRQERLALEREQEQSRQKIEQDQKQDDLIRQYRNELNRAIQADSRHRQKRLALEQQEEQFREQIKREQYDLIQKDPSRESILKFLADEKRRRAEEEQQERAAQEREERRRAQEARAKTAERNQMQAPRREITNSEYDSRTAMEKKEAEMFESFKVMWQKLMLQRHNLIGLSQINSFSYFEKKSREQLLRQEQDERRLLVHDSLRVPSPESTSSAPEIELDLLEDLLAQIPPEDREEFMRGYGLPEPSASAVSEPELTAAAAARDEARNRLLKPEALEHIMQRHGADTGESPYRFLASFSNQSGLERIIQETIQRGVSTPQTMPDGTVRMVYTFNFKYQIGFAGSSATTQMRVVVDHGNQKVITAYPQGFQEGLKTARSFSGSLARTAELLRAIEFIITSEDPGVQVRTRQNGDLFYEYSYPVAIGTTVHGQPTNRIRVVVSSKGDVLRVYPVSE